MSCGSRAGRRGVHGLLVLALVALALAGCLGGDEAVPVPTLAVEPRAEAQAGEPLAVTVRAGGEGLSVLRIGLGWSTGSTRAIPLDRLMPAAFDGVLWAEGGTVTPATRNFEIPALPAVGELFLRPVAEMEERTVWGDEVRFVVTAPPPPIPIEVRLAGLPLQAYPREVLTFAVDVAGWNGTATEIGVAWGAASNLARDPETLRATHYEESILLDARSVPGRHNVTDWTNERNETVFMRAWVVAAGARHWSGEVRLQMGAPPVVDHGPGKELHQVRVAPHLLPLPLFSSFAPETLTLRVGDSIAWVNDDTTVHTASHVPAEGEDVVWFHTGSLGPGVTSPVYRFLVPGEYDYVCRVHPETMHGSLRVEA